MPTARRTIAVQLALGTLGVVMACLVPVFFGARSAEWSNMVEGKGHAAVMVARTLADSVAPGLAFDDDKTTREPVEALLRNSEVLSVRIDRAGHPEPIIGAQPDVTPIQARPGKPLEAVLVVVDGRPRVEVQAPVELDGEILGEVLVAVSLAREEELHAANLWRTIGGFVVLALVLIISVLAVFGALVGRRLEQLRRTTQRIAGGERVTTNLAGADEVATLGNAIDSMAASIWRRQDDVQRTHEALMAERQQYAEGLAEARDAAVDHSRAKTEFLQTMSHELRTPMNGIIGMTRLLRDTTLDAQQADYVEMIRASSESLFAITSDILDFSKLDAGKVQLERVEFDVQDVLDEVMSVLAGPAAARHLALAAWCRPGVPLVVSGDPSRLRQVLLNLVSNAVKFTEQGRVTVEVSDHAGSLRFSVVDTGCGISPEAQARLFTPFTQADSSTTRKYGGTGLGLAIVKRLVDLMGGRVTLSSSAAGSVFEVTVPLPAIELRKTPELTGHTVVLGVEHPVHTPALEALLMRVGARVVKVHRPEAVPTEGVALVPATWVDALPVGPAIGLLTDARLTPQPRQAAFQVTRPVRRQALVAELRRAFGLQSAGALVAELPRFEGVRVLVAEDNTINQRVICGLLERLGCHPTVVGDGRASVTAIATGRFEVVLMDCQMPELDGLAATRELRLDEANRSLPIIALTANATNEDQAACLAAGMNGFLSKPVRLETLAEELKRHLGVRSASVVG